MLMIERVASKIYERQYDGVSKLNKPDMSRPRSCLKLIRTLPHRHPVAAAVAVAERAERPGQAGQPGSGHPTVGKGAIRRRVNKLPSKMAIVPGREEPTLASPKTTEYNTKADDQE